MAEMSKAGVVIVGAGSSSRMGGGVNKVFAELLHRPTLAWTVQAFESSDLVGEIVVVLSGDLIGDGKRLMAREGWNKVSQIVEGGNRRQDSVLNGLSRLHDSKIVMIHDAARPCITPDVIERGMVAVQWTGAAKAGVRVVDTLDVVESLEMIDTIPRERIWRAQTPQVFDYPLIMRAHSQVKEDVTDDATMIKRIGGKVMVFEGSNRNIKITTRADLADAEDFLRRTDPIGL